jgi:hypothetical protein
VHLLQRSAALAGALVCAAVLGTFAAVQIAAQGRGAAPMGPVQGEKFRTQYIRLGSNQNEGLLYDPITPGPNARIALVYSHPNGNNFNQPFGREMANRGYRALMVNYRGEEESPDVYAPSISRGIEFLRTLPGVQKVVVMGHSGGGHLMGFYANVAEHGPAACQGPEKLYPCKGEGLTGLAKPDGLVLLDSTTGAFHAMSAVDPAVEGKTRNSALDMFTAANGYDKSTKSAKYSAAFAKKFYAAQSAGNERIVNHAVERLRALERGAGEFKDVEPLVIREMGNESAGARLYQPDPAFAARTKKPHMLLKADGTRPEVIVPSVRPPSGQQGVEGLGTLSVMTQNTTVRRFLALDAIRTTPDFAITADDIVGVKWATSSTSTIANAEGITVPTLVMVMTCHYLIVPGELIFDHLASKDKTFAGVEGAVHGFNPCRPEYGDTVKRTFDFVDGWLGKAGRF